MSKPSLEEIKQDMEQKRRAAAAAAAYVAYDDAATYADAIAAADVYYECCDEHEVSYMGACGMCLTEEINEMIADPKAISLVDKDFLKAVLSFIPAPTTSSDASELAKDVAFLQSCVNSGETAKPSDRPSQRNKALEKNDE